jgi:hypothetical protein
VNPLSASVFSAPDRWLRVTVSGTPLSCQRISSVVYAIQAQVAADADTVDGYQAAEILSRANHTGTQPPSSISPQGASSGLGADTVDGLHASQIAGTGGVPSGAIILWTGSSCPSAWSRFTALDGRFPRGASTYGGTGGAETHAHSYSGTSGGSNSSARGTAPTLSGDYTPPGHAHTYSGNTDSASNLPPYLNIIFCQKD